MKKTILILFIITTIFTGKTLAQFSAGHGLMGSFNFEAPDSAIRFDTMPGNLWQIGHPNKTIFQSGHSSPGAIVTDTLNSYPINNRSVFEFTIDSINLNFHFGTYIDFWHRWNTDTLHDFGIVEFAVDNDTIWHVMRDTFGMVINGCNYFMLQWYDYDSLGNPILPYNNYFSGNSPGWIHSYFEWQWAIPVLLGRVGFCFPDSVRVRFIFQSDSLAENKDGWEIDDLSYGWYDVLGGISNKDFLNQFSISPNPINDVGIITNTSPKIFTDLKMQIMDITGRIIRENKINSGENIRISHDGISPGLYMVKITEKDEVVGILKVVMK